MSSDDNIFFASDEPLDAVVGWLAGALQLERPAENQHFFGGRARTVDGRLLLLVEPNIYGEADPAPEDVSAIDRYTGAVDVRISGSRDGVAQAKEARAVFDELASTQPRVALVLATAMSWIVAAYLPGAGVHTFPPETSLDADDIDSWRAWVVG
ncbi:hypothetical protein OHB24_39510 [Kribbella sp. NBC_00482]|uniref:hypothetical protein n=1 Tax=Kribbella sp. NBC_00482 TaxID=2975968 RepID=UPI002E174BEA